MRFQPTSEWLARNGGNYEHSINGTMQNHALHSDRADARLVSATLAFWRAVGYGT